MRYDRRSSSYRITSVSPPKCLLCDPWSGFTRRLKFPKITGKPCQVLFSFLCKKFRGLNGYFPTALYSIAARQVILKANQSIFYLNTQSGFDQSLPQTAVRKGLEISREFVDGEGNQLDTFEQGEEITVRLRIRALEKTVTNVAIVDLLPGRFEVLRSSVPRTAYNWRADYVDVREDRVIFYGTFDTSIKELEYKVKLTAAGNFVVPPAFAESMYDRSIKASTVAARFEVTPSH